MEYKPGDIIDLSKFNKKEKGIEQLMPLLEMASAQTNEWVEREFGLKNLVNKDGSISMKGFAVENDGPYSVSDIENDENKITNIEKKFAGVENEQDVVTQNNIIETWHKNRLKQKSSKVEVLITVLLHRVLKDKFIVARTAPIDDYTQGADYIIVNPTTGETICAFDGVGESDSAKNKISINYTNEKRIKTETITKKGGANIKYGIQVVDDKLIRKNISNMPVFYLSLSDKDFDSLMALTGNRIDTPITQDESTVFTKFITSLEDQRSDLLKLDLQKNSPIHNKLLEFEKTLDMLKSISPISTQGQSKLAA